MGDTKRIKVYHWKYDDGSRGYAVRLIQSEKKEWLKYDYCTEKTEFKRLIQNLESKYDPPTVTKRKCWIPGGLSDMCPSNFSPRDAYDSKEGVAAMNDLIHSSDSIRNSAQMMLQLLSAILAGYSTQACSGYFTTERVPPKARRAPIISVSYSDYAYLILEQIVSSLAVDTTAVNSDYMYIFAGKPLEAKYMPLLPCRAKDRSITDSAYVKLPGLPHTVMPQYRDTTMLVHCRFFLGSEIAELQRLNPWVSLVLYDAPSMKFLSSPVRIDGRVLAASSGSWDRKKLQFVVDRYASYISRKAKKKRWGKDVSKYLENIEQMISHYNQQINTPHVLRAQKYQVSCQMLALRLFLDACLADHGITKDQASALSTEWFSTEWFSTEWFNILLPGCCSGDASENLSTLDEGPVPFQTQFESAICSILQEDNYQHIYFVSKGNICPFTANGGNNTEYWAYVSWYRSKKTPPHLVLRLRRKTFERLFPKYCQDYRGENLFNDIGQLDAEYIDSLKARMYRNETDAAEKSTVDALVLNVDRMTFLPQDVTNYLRKFTDDRKPDI